MGTKKNEKGEGKETENRKKRKRDDEAEDREIETEENWRSFITNRMMKMDVALGSLAKKNAELRKEVREM